MACRNSADPENPGFKKFIISPYLPSDLTYVNCTYESPFGKIKSNWEKSKVGVKHEITVPKSTTASFYVPSDGKASFKIENTASGKVLTQNASGSLFKAELPEGSYLITY